MLSRSGSGRTRASFAAAPSVAGAKADKPKWRSPSQAEHQGKGFFIGEHQRGQAKPWLQPVETAYTSDRFDGYGQVLQSRDIPLDRAQVDLQAGRQFAAADAVAGLQNFEDGQYAHDRVVHAFSSCHQITTEVVGNRG